MRNVVAENVVRQVFHYVKKVVHKVSLVISITDCILRTSSSGLQLTGCCSESSMQRQRSSVWAAVGKQNIVGYNNIVLVKISC